MTTKETVQRYFDALKQKKGWESFFADDIAFTSYTSPARQLNGKETCIQATKRFYSMIANVSVRDLIVEGDKACALTHYELQPPTGAPAFESDVAEIFSVSNGKINSFGIYFDSAPYPK